MSKISPEFEKPPLLAPAHTNAFYTDGSKKDEIASWGMYSELGVASARICDDSSIFTAEVEGINRALRHIEINPKLTGKFVVFSDSKSVLESNGGSCSGLSTEKRTCNTQNCPSKFPLHSKIFLSVTHHS